MPDPVLDENITSLDRENMLRLASDDNNVYRRVFAKGIVSAAGLSIAGQVTEITLNTSTWTALERSGSTNPNGSGALTDRNAISIQNNSADDVILNYVDSGSVGVLLQAGNERHTDITDGITIYALALTGTPTVILEEQS